jgi:hypothetical protein
MKLRSKTDPENIQSGAIKPGRSGCARAIKPDGTGGSATGTKYMGEAGGESYCANCGESAQGGPLCVIE